MKNYFSAVLGNYEPTEWNKVDLTEFYKTARRICFEKCARGIVHAKPGESYLIHRLALHGIAPWRHTGTMPPEGRMICYFRPHLQEISDWLS